MCQSSVVYVSSVPASCVLIWFVSCPCLVWLLVKSVPAVFVSLTCVFKFLPVQFRVVYSLLPGVSVCVSLALSYPALFIYIKDYYLSLLLVCMFLYPPRVCTVTPCFILHLFCEETCFIQSLNLSFDNLHRFLSEPFQLPEELTLTHCSLSMMITMFPYLLV